MEREYNQITVKGLICHTSGVERTALKSVSRSLEAVETQLQSALLLWFVCLEKSDNEELSLILKERKFSELVSVPNQVLVISL